MFHPNVTGNQPPALPPKTEDDLKYDHARHVTMKAFSLAKFPFFIRGLQCWKNSLHPASGYPMDSGLGKIVGSFFILFAIPLTAVNAVAAVTGAAGAAYLGAAKVERQLQGPDEYRHQFIQSIVRDLNASIAQMEPDARDFYLNNPTKLAGALALNMAFLSRKTWDYNALDIDEKRVELKDIYDPNTKEYFSKLLEIKQAIERLHFHSNDAEDWAALEAERMDAAEPAIANASPVHAINEAARGFAEKLKSDPLFMQYWQEQHPRAAGQ